jgi:hypothetical protein
MLSLAAILALCSEVNIYTGSASPCYGIACLNSRLVQCSAMQQSASQLSAANAGYNVAWVVG